VVLSCGSVVLWFNMFRMNIQPPSSGFKRAVTEILFEWRGYSVSCHGIQEWGPEKGIRSKPVGLNWHKGHCCNGYTGLSSLVDSMATSLVTCIHKQAYSCSYTPKSWRQRQHFSETSLSAHNTAWSPSQENRRHENLKTCSKSSSL
jgi:hypothetical protein